MVTLQIIDFTEKLNYQIVQGLKCDVLFNTFLHFKPIQN